MTLVIDASVAVKWLVNERGSEEAATLLAQTTASDGGDQQIEGSEQKIAPKLLLLEVHHALAKKFNEQQVTLEVLKSAPTLIKENLVMEDMDDDLMQDALNLASTTVARTDNGRPELRYGGNDCCYVALAKRRKAQLVTADTRQKELALAQNIVCRFIAEI